MVDKVELFLMKLFGWEICHNYNHKHLVSLRVLIETSIVLLWIAFKFYLKMLSWILLIMLRRHQYPTKNHCFKRQDVARKFIRELDVSAVSFPIQQISKVGEIPAYSPHGNQEWRLPRWWSIAIVTAWYKSGTLWLSCRCMCLHSSNWRVNLPNKAVLTAFKNVKSLR